ncbi:MAG: hypothetical protein R2861_04820 [Desulfobacterales bacterium]
MSELKFGAKTRSIKTTWVFFSVILDKKPFRTPILMDKDRIELAVRFAGRMRGCSVGAKNTLDKNYLYLAEKQGAEIIPETLVTGVRPWNGGYEILTQNRQVSNTPKTYRARGVVFSGGVMGTVKLLMKCKQEGFLPKLSNQLGNYIRTNSEALLGVRSKTKINWNDQIAITSGIYADNSTHIEMVRFDRGDALMNLFSK